MNKKIVLIVLIAAVAVFLFFQYRKMKQGKQQTDFSFPLAPTPGTPKTTITNTQNIALSPGITMKGYAVYPSGTSVNVRREPSTVSEVVMNAKAGTKAGTTTGESKKMADGTWLKIQLSFGIGWVRSDVVKLVAPGTSTIKTQTAPWVMPSILPPYLLGVKGGRK
jgi:hypothetical protein